MISYMVLMIGDMFQSATPKKKSAATPRLNIFFEVKSKPSLSGTKRKN